MPTLTNTISSATATRVIAAYAAKYSRDTITTLAHVDTKRAFELDRFLQSVDRKTHDGSFNYTDPDIT